MNARGERRVVFWRTAPVHDENGEVIAIVSGGADITMRRKRELELERERDVQTTVFESMPSIMVVLAPDGTIRDRDAEDRRVGANRAFTKAVVWPDDQLVGRPFLDILVEDDDGRAARAIAAAAAGQTSEEVESQLLSADGSSRVYAWSATSYRGRHGAAAAAGARLRRGPHRAQAARGRERARARIPQRDREQRAEPPVPRRRRRGDDREGREHRVRAHPRVRAGGDRRPGLLGDVHRAVGGGRGAGCRRPHRGRSAARRA